MWVKIFGKVIAFLLNLQFAMQLFFHREISPSTTIGQSIVVTGELFKRISVVLRCRVGDRVTLCNGQGTLYHSVVSSVGRAELVVEVDGVEAGYGQQSEIVVGIAPTKNAERVEWAVEKMVEIGVGRIVPLLCDRGVRRKLRVDRLERIACSAAEQSLKGYMPEIEQMCEFEEFLRRYPRGYIAHCEDAERKSNVWEVEARSVIVIGPEGDFSPGEVELAREYGYQEISLGESRLRTETAAIVAVVHMVKE